MFCKEKSRSENNETIALHAFQLISLLAFFSFPLTLAANPQGGSTVSGSAEFIASNRDLMEVVASDRSIIEWNDFSINPEETTRFVMPHESAVVLNKVVTQTVSMISGKLESNGRVVLINPNGVVFGKTGAIDTASLIVSTTDVLADAFRSKGEIVYFNKPNSNIVCDGKIHASSGSIVLLGKQVFVDGQIAARCNGEGGSIGLFGEHIELGSNAFLDANGKNGGTVSIGIDSDRHWIADRVVSHPGSMISASGAVSGNGGKIFCYASSSLVCSGALFAEGGSEFGDGGAVDISTGSILTYNGSVSTFAPNGKTGTLLFDPIDLTISTPPGDVSVTAGPNFVPTANGANLTPASIIAALATNNVVVSTIGTVGMPDQSGMITVNDPISWSTANSLSFFAVGDIVVNQSVENLHPGTGSLFAQSNTGSIYIGNAAMTNAARFGSDRGAVTVIACAGDVVLRGSDTTNLGYAVIGGYNTPAPPTVATGNLTVQAGRNLILFSGTGNPLFGPGMMQRSFAAITKMGPQVSVNVDSDIFVTVGQDLLMDTSGKDECETYIGHGGVFFGASTIRGNITVNVRRNAILTSRWDGGVITDTRCYIGSSAVAATHRSIMNINIGQDLIFQGATGPGLVAQGQHSYIGGGGSSTLTNYRQQLSLNVGRDFIMDARLLLNADIQTNNDSADPSILPINRIHVGRNFFLIGGGFAVSRPFIINYQATLPYTHEIWVGSNIICINGSVNGGDSTLVRPGAFASSNINRVNVRAGGDILLAAGINSQNLFRSTGGVTMIADDSFAAGELWPAQFASVCGGANIFTGTALGSASSGIASNGAGGIQIDTGRYNNSAYNFTTLSGQILVAPGTQFLTYAMQNGSSFIWRSSPQFAISGMPTNFLISNSANGLVVNNTLAGAPFLSNGINISISGFQNIDISGASLTAPSGNIFVSAQNDMTLAGAAITASGSVNLVVDNQAPAAPLIGPGAFVMDDVSQINGSSIGIYTAQRSQNSIDAAALFNGVDIATLFSNAGLVYGLTEPLTTLFQNTNLEVWCIYFQQALPTIPLTIFYKPCLETVTEQANLIVSELLYTFSETLDADWPYHGLNEYYGWPAKFVIYYSSQLPGYENWPNEMYFIRRRNELLIPPRGRYDSRNDY